MTKMQRLRTVAEAAFLLLCAVLILRLPDMGYLIVSALVCLSLVLAGLKELFYYFAMARHMVGGKNILYRGVLLTDLGLFTGSIASVPRVYILIYLAVFFGFAGFVDVVGALSARRDGAHSWRMRLLQGALNVLLVLLCLLFLGNERLVEFIFCFSLVNSAVIKMITAFRRTAVIYIS